MAGAAFRAVSKSKILTETIISLSKKLEGLDAYIAILLKKLEGLDAYIVICPNMHSGPETWFIWNKLFQRV